MTLYIARKTTFGAEAPGAGRTISQTLSLRPLRARSLFLALFLLAGCAAPPKRPVPQDVDAAWEAHRAQMAQLVHWRLSASIAVRAGRDGGQANVEWIQRATGYDIRLEGPFGSGAARLSGDEEGATLILDNGERLSGADPARLLSSHLGWRIPVGSLRYWAVGLPDPALPADGSLDEYGRLASLEQDGWRVRFEKYETAGALELPARVTIVGDDTEVRMVARRWRIPMAKAQ